MDPLHSDTDKKKAPYPESSISPVLDDVTYFYTSLFSSLVPTIWLTTTVLREKTCFLGLYRTGWLIVFVFPTQIEIHGAAAYQLGNTSSRMITEVKQR